MAEKRYYWLKLQEEFFRQKEVVRLRRMDGGDTYVIIYVKMLLKSLQDGGYLHFDGYYDSFIEELSADLDENPGNVGIVVGFLKSKGLLEERDEETFLLTKSAGLVGSETKDAERKRIERKKSRTLLGQCPDNVQNNVGNCPIDKEIEIEIEQEQDIEQEREIDTYTEDVCASDELAIKVLAYWNTIAEKFDLEKKELIEKGSPIHRMLLRMLDEYGFNTIVDTINSIKESDFLLGMVDTWKIDFDWLINPRNFLKVKEGKYKTTRKKTGRTAEGWSRDGTDMDRRLMEKQIEEMRAERR